MFALTAGQSEDRKVLRGKSELNKHVFVRTYRKNLGQLRFVSWFSLHKYFCILLVNLKRFYKLMRQNVKSFFFGQTGNLFGNFYCEYLWYVFAVVSENSFAEESAKLPRVRVQILWPFTDFRFLSKLGAWQPTVLFALCSQTLII